MKRLCLLLAAAIITACSAPFTVEFQDEDTATIRMSKAQEQTLWIPIDNTAHDVKLTLEGCEAITVPLNVRMAVERVQYWMPLHLDSSVQRITIDGCPQQSVAWQALTVGARRKPRPGEVGVSAYGALSR